MTDGKAPDALWLTNLIGACDDVLERLPDDPATTSLHADIVSLRADLRAQLAELEA